MDLNRDHPDVARALRTGYPDAGAGRHYCAGCGAELTDAYIAEGEELCVDCFRDWVLEYASTDPAAVAAALKVRVFGYE